MVEFTAVDSSLRRMRTVSLGLVFKKAKKVVRTSL